MRLIDADALTEAIKGRYCDGCDNYNEVRCRACSTDDALTMIDEAATVETPKWISVYDRLPEKRQVVICTDGKHTWDVGVYQGQAWPERDTGDPTNWAWKHNTYRRVMWWMPKKGALPEAPKEGNDG